MYNIHLLPASFGDSILIEYGNDHPRYILIDGGPYYAYDGIIAAIKRIAPDIKELELLVATHVDIDHIDGVITLLNQSQFPFAIKQIWFNGYDEMVKLLDPDFLGGLQGEYLSRLITKKKIPINAFVDGGALCVRNYSALPESILEDGMRLTILGPGVQDLTGLLKTWDKQIAKIGDEAAITKRWDKDHRYKDRSAEDMLGSDDLGDDAEPDKSPANRSSIAFIASYDGKNCLFSGDSTSECLLRSINSILSRSEKNKLTLDAWKLSHHGSSKSTQVELMNKIDCNKILISSDGKRYQHPDKECIQNLLESIDSKLNFYFNYRSVYNEIWENKSIAGGRDYEVYYPKKEGDDGISITL